MPEVHEILDQRVGVGKQPYAVKSVLGWTIRGPLGVKGTNLKCVNVLETQERSLVDELVKFYEAEFKELGDPEERSLSLDDRNVLLAAERNIALVDGKYSLSLPMRENVILPNNYVSARRRLELLKKRLFRNKDLFARYSAVMRDHIAKGYISQDNESDNEGRWYLPHHPVLNTHKPGKVCTVFDCAAQFE